LPNFIYISTLSKLISPAIRIGYLYCSPDLIDKIKSLRSIIDMYGDNIMEQSILELIDSGDIRRHAKRAVSYYKQKRDRFVELLDQHLQDKAFYQIPDGGLAVWLSFPENINLFKVQEITLKKGLNFYTPERFSFKEPINGIRIGYASLSEENMERGLQILSNHL